MDAAGLWTSSKLAMSFVGAPSWAICAGCAGASVALNAVVAESVASELEESASAMAALEN